MEFDYKDFREERVELDGNSFKHCTFTKCDLVFRGMAPVSLQDNAVANSSFKFEGAALATLQFMQDLYHGGMKDMMEATFQNIRKPPDS